MIYKSSMDKGTIRKTAFVFLLFASLFVFLVVYAWPTDFIIVPIFVLLIYVGIISYGIYETPIRYIVSPEKLSIVSRWNQTYINMNEIKGAWIFDTADRKGLVKKMGAEGVLGNSGSYSSDKFKYLTVMTSRDTNWVRIEKKNGYQIVISPDDMGIVDVINDYARHLSGG